MPATTERGFTLTELAVVLTIVALLLGGALYTLSAQTEARNLGETERRLEQARELLLGFAVANGRLPCPASLSAGTGDEAPTTGGACTDAYAGYLPARAIGFTPVDSAGYGLDVWGNRIRYAVSINSSVAGNPDYVFTTAPMSPATGIKYNFNPSSGTNLAPQDLVVCAAYDSGTGSTTTGAPSCGTAASAVPATNTNTVVAVVWSQGRNFTSATFSGVSGQSGTDESFNNKIRLPAANNNHGVFIHHPPRPLSEANAYDDQMVWIPAGMLYGRMIAAGAVP